MNIMNVRSMSTLHVPAKKPDTHYIYEAFGSREELARISDAQFFEALCGFVPGAEGKEQNGPNE